MLNYYYLDGSVLGYRDYNRILHRLDGPAVECGNGDMEWYQNGLRHRLDGPATERNNGNDLEWWQNGKLHRLEGPAVEYQGGDVEWYINGKEFGKKEFEKQILTMKLSGLLNE